MTNSIKAALKQPVLAFAFIVLSYFVFGVSGTLFKIEPGFASAIWPAAGCAIVLALRYGQFAYLPLFIGSLLTNLYSSGAYYSTSFVNFL